jgi:hypothetical protein
MTETTLTLVHASKSRAEYYGRKTTTTFTTANDVSSGGSCFIREHGRIGRGFGRLQRADAYRRCRIVVTRQAANRRWPISRRSGKSNRRMPRQRDNAPITARALHVAKRNAITAHVRFWESPGSHRGVVIMVLRVVGALFAATLACAVAHTAEPRPADACKRATFRAMIDVGANEPGNFFRSTVERCASRPLPIISRASAAMNQLKFRRYWTGISAGFAPSSNSRAGVSFNSALRVAVRSSCKMSLNNDIAARSRRTPTRI